MGGGLPGGNWVPYSWSWPMKPVLFSDDVVTSLSRSLPKPICERRRELLPQILHEWGRTDLQRHLSRDSRAVIRTRIKKIEQVRKKADELRQALKTLDQTGVGIIETEILRRVEKRKHVSWSERLDFRKRMAEQNEFLTKLTGIAPAKLWNMNRGQPRNDTAYLVLRDAAEIFDWFTGKKAARGVNRDDHLRRAEAGPFFRFASVLWPVVFKKGTQGLPAAMKNWAQGRLRYKEQSALIANIRLRHPTWGIFEC
jgi:hypothetical protein